jgi:polysaccharide pyruvyl transferase CsaB
MAEILVFGYYGFHNAGDEAILSGMLQALRELAPDVSVTVVSGTAAETRDMHGAKAISRGAVRQIWQAIGRADLVIFGGGSLLQDVTSSRSLSYYLSLVVMAKARSKPVLFYAQGIGPISGILGKSLIPLVVNTVDVISVRDRESAETLRKLGVRRPPITVTADPALGLGPSDPVRGAELLAAAGVDLSRPVIGVSVRPWKQWERQLEPVLARALDDLIRETGAQVAFLPMQQQSKDVEAATVVTRLMKEPAQVLVGPYTHVELQALIARCNLVIGMRYHALVFAAMNGVPLVGLSYDPKNDAFLRMIGEKAAGSTGRLDAGRLTRAARQALAEAPAFRERLLQRMAELTPLSRKNAQLAVDLLKRRDRR